MGAFDTNPSGPTDLNAARVLIVGRGTEADLISKAVEAAGMEPVHAEDGPTAFDAFSSHSPEAVVIDLNGPGLGSAEVCDALDRLDGRGVPKFIVIDSDDSHALQRAFESGATDVLSRPVMPEFFARRLQHLARRPSGRDGETCSLDRTTGLADKDELVSRVAKACEQARAENSNAVVLHLELGRFRELVHGLATGSATQLLTAVSRRLRDCIRASDALSKLTISNRNATIARTGGGEFSILLQGLDRVEDAAKAARRLLDSLSDPFELLGQQIGLEATVGIASFPQEDVAATELVECARTAGHNALQEGAGTIRFYTPTMNAKAFERLSLEASLREALDRDEFLVYYQPRIEISSGNIVGYEALVRWRHPQLGLVAPGQFIPLAEETGLIVPIGEFVLRTACAQNREWQRRGLPPISISVNLSSVQFQQPELFDTVVRVLGETGLDPSWLELELTESLLMQNADSVVQTLKRFRDTGIKLSIDDFGTGYSSLSYLKRFPIDALKIDREFIREVTTNADDAALATSIILMGRSLKLKVVAEGVETASQLSFLRIMQCDEAQGFLYSPPVAAEEAERMLREGPSTAAA